MADFEEVVLFEQGKVKITSRRVIGEDHSSYALSELASVVVCHTGRRGIGRKFVVRLQTITHQARTIYESQKRGEAEVVARAIRTAMLVGADVPGFRAIFYHPQLHREAEAQETWDAPDLWW
jgi:hypothetical protein